MLNKKVVSENLLLMYYKLRENSIFNDYILAGGTALALQMGHRISTDLDMFTYKEQDNKELLDYFMKAFEHYDLNSIKNGLLQLNVNNIKLDFVKINSNMIEDAKSDDGIIYFGKKDIAAMKLRATLTRTKVRDYIDIAYLLNDFSLNELFKFYSIKYNSDDTNILKSSLLKCQYFQKNDWVKEVNMLRNDIDIYDIPNIIKHEIETHNRKHNIGNNINLLYLFKRKTDIAPMVCVKYDSFEDAVLEDKIELHEVSILKNWGKQPEGFFLKKLRYNNNGNKIFVLERQLFKKNDNGFITEVWHFKENFNKDSALNFLNQFDDNYTRGMVYSNKEDKHQGIIKW